MTSVPVVLHQPLLLSAAAASISNATAAAIQQQQQQHNDATTTTTTTTTTSSIRFLEDQHEHGSDSACDHGAPEQAVDSSSCRAAAVQLLLGSLQAIRAISLATTTAATTIAH